LWCWKRLSRVSWIARRSNQSILREIYTEYSLEELMLKLKLQYFGHLMQKANSLGKSLMPRKIEGRRRHKRCWFDSWVEKIPWRRTWQPTLVFLPGESHGQWNLLGYWVVKSIGLQRVGLSMHRHTHTHTLLKSKILQRL